jgi:CheY-like chemotaxis protein
MARMHGGSTSVVSQPGAGSRFNIMLPWEPALFVDTVERLKSTGKFRPIKFNKGQKPTILLIEDTEEVIMMLSDYLELNGFKTVIARDGLEGVDQAQLTHPDLILMDIQMPVMDGWAFAQAVRQNSAWNAMPLLALTTLNSTESRERATLCGFNGYLVKLDRGELLNAVAEMLLLRQCFQDSSTAGGIP